MYNKARRSSTQQQVSFVGDRDSLLASHRVNQSASFKRSVNHKRPLHQRPTTRQNPNPVAIPAKPTRSRLSTGELGVALAVWKEFVSGEETETAIETTPVVEELEQLTSLIHSMHIQLKEPALLFVAKYWRDLGRPMGLADVVDLLEGLKESHLKGMELEWMSGTNEDMIDAFTAVGGCYDKSGCVDIERMKAAMTLYGLLVDIDHIAAELDTDGNNEIDFEEFSALLEFDGDDDEGGGLLVAPHRAVSDEDDETESLQLVKTTTALFATLGRLRKEMKQPTTKRISGESLDVSVRSGQNDQSASPLLDTGTLNSTTQLRSTGDLGSSMMVPAAVAQDPPPTGTAALTSDDVIEAHSKPIPVSEFYRHITYLVSKVRDLHNFRDRSSKLMAEVDRRGEMLVRSQRLLCKRAVRKAKENELAERLHASKTRRLSTKNSAEDIGPLYEAERRGTKPPTLEERQAKLRQRRSTLGGVPGSFYARLATATEKHRLSDIFNFDIVDSFNKSESSGSGSDDDTQSPTTPKRDPKSVAPMAMLAPGLVMSNSMMATMTTGLTPRRRTISREKKAASRKRQVTITEDSGSSANALVAAASATEGSLTPNSNVSDDDSIYSTSSSQLDFDGMDDDLGTFAEDPDTDGPAPTVEKKPSGKKEGNPESSRRKSVAPTLNDLRPPEPGVSSHQRNVQKDASTPSNSSRRGSSLYMPAPPPPTNPKMSQKKQQQRNVAASLTPCMQNSAMAASNQFRAQRYANESSPSHSRALALVPMSPPKAPDAPRPKPPPLTSEAEKEDIAIVDDYGYARHHMDTKLYQCYFGKQRGKVRRGKTRDVGQRYQPEVQSDDEEATAIINAQSSTNL